MMGLYFQKQYKLALHNGESYIQASNNLDNQYYVLERVKNGGKDYLLNNYFSSSHLQLIKYLTCWNEKEIILQQVPIIKKTKEKKGLGGILGGNLISKKSKIDTSAKPAPKQPKEEVQIVSTEEEVLYIQLQSFSEANVPTDIEEAKQFMAFIYLLSMRIYETFNCWPQMIPVITESKRYKFIKKGKRIEQQLVRLFDSVFKEGKEIALHSWSEKLSAQIQGIQNDEDRKQKIGAFLLVDLSNILKSDFQIKMKKGQEWQALTVTIEDAFTLHFKQTNQQILIDEYQIVYYHNDLETRQIIMEHNIENTIILEGHRSNLIIKYLKQFVNC